MPANTPGTHFTNEQIAAWRANAVSPNELFVLGDHLADCPECRARIAATPEAKSDGDLLHALGIDPDTNTNAHLSYSLLEGWIDKTLSAREREIVSTHLAACDRCRSDVEGLLEFAAELRAEVRADAEAAALLPQTGALVTTPWKVGLGRWWQAPTFGVAGLAAGVVLAYVAVARPAQIEKEQITARASASTALVQTAQQETAQARSAAQVAQSETQAVRARLAHNQGLLQTAQAQGQKAARERIAAQQKAQQLAQANDTLAQRLAAAQKQGGNPTQVAIAPSLPEKTFQTAVKTGNLPALSPRDSEALQPEGVRGPRPPFTGLQPSATRVLPRRPTLSWNRTAEISGGTATLVVRDSNGKEITRHLLAEAQTAYEFDAPLARGGAYSWRIIGADNKPLSSTVRFQVAGSDAVTWYAQTLLRLAVAQSGDGLYEAARTTLAQVISLDAGEATTRQAERLLSSLRNKR